MNNDKMTRVAKNLDIFANVGGKITAGAGVVCMVVAFLALVFGTKMFEMGDTTLNLDFIKFHLNNHSYVNVHFIKFYVFIVDLNNHSTITNLIVFLILHTPFHRLTVPALLFPVFL